jgi:hypothetical protein
MIAMIRSRRAKDVQVILDLGGQFFQLVGDFLDAHCGQALQAQVQDGAGLHLRTGCRCRRRSSCGWGRRSAGCRAAMSWAGQRRVISRSRASAGSAEARMVATTSSTFDTATARPQRTWLRSRALRSSNAVRRATTSSRKVMKWLQEIAQGQVFGRPPFSASMLQPN